MEYPAPGLYRHFKGNEYELLHIATHSETGEMMAVYRALYGERGVWVRPLSMWTEHVVRDGYEGPRFAPQTGETPDGVSSGRVISEHAPREEAR